jgi:hypothetical protein
MVVARRVSRVFAVTIGFYPDAVYKPRYVRRSIDAINAANEHYIAFGNG